ncbi:unnamed protein product, partial [marine sediment metagenome]
AYFAVDDYVELSVYQNSGGDLNLEWQSIYAPFFMAQRIG